MAILLGIVALWIALLPRPAGTARPAVDVGSSARYVAADVQWHGQKIAAGAYLLLLNGSANRDGRHFDDPDRYDLHREGGHLSFGQGIHFCLGSALARLEARVAFEELLARWPEWDVDYAGAERARTSSVRGWVKLPVRTR